MSIVREDIVALLAHRRAFARSLTGGNRDLADDLVQDTLVNAMKAQDQFTPGTNRRAWLFTILRNRFRSVVTRRHVAAEVAVDDLESRWWTPATPDSGQEMDAFCRAFACLSPAHREVCWRWSRSCLTRRSRRSAAARSARSRAGSTARAAQEDAARGGIAGGAEPGAGPPG